MDIRIKLAENEKEKHEIYKLRYKIYVDELKFNEFSNREKMIKDDFDENAHIFAAYDGELLVGTSRTNMAKYGKLEYEKEGKIRELFSAFYPQSISASSKYMVLREYRSSTVALELAISNYIIALDNNLLFDFIFTSGYHAKHYMRLGYKPYTDNFYSEIFPEKYREIWPLVFEAQNLEHLKEINSPFAGLLLKYMSENNFTPYYYC